MVLLNRIRALCLDIYVLSHTTAISAAVVQGLKSVENQEGVGSSSESDLLR